ncbi:AAA family ATPase, partial [Staphylococcus hominis]|uniref:AAA family ATPase n=1 Tax=Staphylococcus hominis TaxID=1290 RepID=UPI001643E122
YLPHHHPRQLTQKLTPNPYSLILFHQIQKPHPHLFNILLQLLHHRHLTHTKRPQLHFPNTLIIITSNLPPQQLQHQPFPPFPPPSQPQHYQTIPTTIIKQLKNSFPPQFLNP